MIADPRTPEEWRAITLDMQQRAETWRLLASTVADQPLPSLVRDDFVSTSVEGCALLARAAQEVAYVAGICATELEETAQAQAGAAS